VLNIGKLSPGAADYYVGEVATSAEDYYTGRGEAKGRWVGSLRPVLGLGGEVDPEDFRAVLAGRHPVTGVMLISSQGSAGRAVGIDTHAFTLTDASPGTMAGGLIGAIQGYLSGRPELDQEAVKERVDDLRELDSWGEFLFSYLRFLVSGTV